MRKYKSKRVTIHSDQSTDIPIQTIYQLAECIQLKPVQATKFHIVNSSSVHSNIKQPTVLSTDRVIVYFFPKSYIARVSVDPFGFSFSTLLYVLCAFSE